jgi:hypothetical protein
MEFEFESNEFTTWDLLEYLQRAYGAQVSGQPFTISNVNVWIRMKKLPDAYGGNRILKVDRYKELDNLRIITVERLSRGDIEAVYGALSNFKETLNKFRAQTPRIRSRKLRTELYYQLLGSRGRRKAVVIPDDYRMVGIRENQFKRGKRSKIDKLDIKQPAHH